MIHLLLACLLQAQALTNILRTYQTSRLAGMGSTGTTTGLYSDNFFNNPARTLFNPESRFTLFEWTLDGSSSLTEAIPLLTGNPDAMKIVNTLRGKTYSLRLGLLGPAYYHAASKGSPFAWGVGTMLGGQTSLLVERSIGVQAPAFADGVLAFSGAYGFFDDMLAVGANLRLHHRIGGEINYGLLDLLSAQAIQVSRILGEGSMINMDLGTTFRILDLDAFDLSLSASIQNLFGDTFWISASRLLDIAGTPPSQLRTFAIGFQLFNADLKFSQSFGLKRNTLAFELRDLTFQTPHSLWTLLHVGLETHLWFLRLRGGLNQGYLAGGLGLDIGWWTLDFATYTEELAFNTGLRPERRYGLTTGIHF